MNKDYFSITVFRFVIVSSLFFQGCRFFSGELDVIVVLPELPVEWEGFKKEIEFRLIYPDSEGNETSLDGINPEEKVGITISKSANFPVIALPCLKTVFPLSGGMRSAGGIYPFALRKNDEFHLCWSDGFLTECLMAVEFKSGRVEGVNSRRLMKAIEDEAGGDPWFLDSRRLIRPLLFGRFYGGFIAASPVYPVILPSSQSEWSSGDPLFRAADHIDPDKSFSGGETCLLLPSGYHRFIAPDGGSVLDIAVDDSGVEYFPDLITD